MLGILHWVIDVVFVVVCLICLVCRLVWFVGGDWLLICGLHGWLCLGLVCLVARWLIL